MGTKVQWAFVIGNAVVVGGAMLAWTRARRKGAGRKPPLVAWDFAVWALNGLAIGIVSTFHEAAFHRPLVEIVVVSFVSGTFASYCAMEWYRKAR